VAAAAAFFERAALLKPDAAPANPGREHDHEVFQLMMLDSGASLALDSTADGQRARRGF
jgi:hypothetical protein